MTTTPLPNKLTFAEYEHRLANAVNQWMALPESPGDLLDVNDTALITETPSNVPWPTAKPRAEPESPPVLAEIIAALPGTLVVLDSRGCVKLWTDAATLTFGWSNAEVIGAPPPFLSPGQSIEHRSILEVLKSGHVLKERIVNRLCKDGTSRTLALAATTTIRGDIVMSFREVAKASTVADTAGPDAPPAKLETLGRIVAAVSHDFNNVLGAIGGSADLLAQRPTFNHNDRELIEVIRKASGHASRLTKRLAQFAKPGTVTPTAVDVSMVLLDLLPVVKALVPAGVNVTCQAPPALPMAIADATALEQVVLNLAMNAGEAMSRSGMLHLRVDTATLALPKLTLAPENT